MFRFLNLSNVLGLSRSGKDRRRQASQQRPSVRLMLEEIEDRVVPVAVANGPALLAAIAAGGNVTATLTASFGLTNTEGNNDVEIPASVAAHKTCNEFGACLANHWRIF